MLEKHNKLNCQEIISLDNLKKGLARTKNNVSPGLGKLVKANFTDKKLNSLFKELKSQRFKPSPVKRVNIPKPNGREFYRKNIFFGYFGGIKKSSW